jgi:hypothetical protein
VLDFIRLIFIYVKLLLIGYATRLGTGFAATGLLMPVLVAEQMEKLVVIAAEW